MDSERRMNENQKQDHSMDRGQDRKQNEREIVLDLLMKTEHSGTHSHVLVRRALDRCGDLEDAQRSFIKRLYEGTLERQIELDRIIDRHLKDPSIRLKQAVRCVLRMSLYQIYYMDAVPDYAVLNEAGNLLRRRGLAAQVRFVNGVLRTVLREKEAGADPLDSQGEEAPLSVRYSMPPLMISIWEKQYGKEETEALLQSLLEIRPVTIRIDERLSQAQAEELIRGLKEAGADPQPAGLFPYARTIRGGGKVTGLPGFAEGLFTVQDLSSMTVAEAAGIGGGETIFDLCAAPGGKSVHCASKLLALAEREGKPAGRVYAFDVSADKIRMIRENAQRMKTDNVICGVRDARSVSDQTSEKADIVLCDVPCSGLGVIGRKRDIKYHVSREKLTSLTYLQKEILRGAVRCVKKGGVLIYSTCTIHRAENEEMARFIQEELGFEPDPLFPHLPEELRKDFMSWKPHGSRGSLQLKRDPDGNMLQLLPHRHASDGFFVARFRRRLHE